MMSDSASSSRQAPRGWHNRGYLPHFDAGPVIQTVTFRLADSLPVHVVDAWQAELRRLPENRRAAELRTRAEAHIDQGYGACHLRNPAVAEMVEGALLHFHGERYQMLAWVVMPNHVHAMFEPLKGWSLSAILHTWKSFTSHRANQILRRSGAFWHPDYFDRFIRDEDHFRRALVYIEDNPVKAGLCARPENWPYGSARRRAQG
jgi:putative DNA methylase